MNKSIRCLLMLMISAWLHQTTGHLCPDTNTTTVAYIPNEKSLDNLRRQVELLNSSNEKLITQIKLLNERHNEMQSKLSDALNTNRLDKYMEMSNQVINKLSQHVLNSNANVSNDAHTTDCSAKRKYQSSCAEIAKVKRANGLQTIQVDLFDSKPFLVSCDDTLYDGSWTVIQRRQDGSIDFFRDWAEYKRGFGNLAGEFFIGLDKLYALTTATPQELLIIMKDFEGVSKYAKYDEFAIGDESEAYTLKALGKYSGDAADSLIYHVGQKFSTKDRHNDINTSNCAVAYNGAWWYKQCHKSNLNGLYLKGNYAKDKYAQGIDWYDWHGHYYSLKYVQMMIRPKRN